MYVIFGWHMDDYAANILATLPGRTIVIGALGAFVFLSGYILTSHYGTVNTAKDILRFINKRVLRIYPLYLSSLILLLVTAEITAKQFWAGTLLLNAVLDIKLITLWFVAMIFIFYLILPLMLYRYSLTRFIISLGSFLCICILLDIFAGWIDTRMYYYLTVFVFGVLCSKNPWLFAKLKSIFSVLISMVVLSFVTYLAYQSNPPWFKHIYIVSSLVFSISPLLFVSEYVADRVSPSIFLKLSYASFCMYLYHRFIFSLLLKAYMPPSNSGIVLYLFVIGLPLLYVTATSVQKGYDALLKNVVDA